MTAATPLAAAADRLEAAAAAFVALAPAVAAGSPWPLAERFGTEPEASWGPPEALAHVAEMIPFWLGETERVLDGAAAQRAVGAAAPTPFGRTADDVLRIGVIGRDRTVPARELFARVAADARRLAARMRGLDATDAASVGLHPRLGEMTVAAVLDRFVVTHLEDHVAQLEASLGGRP